VQGPFDLLQQRGDAVEGKAGSQTAEVARRYAKRGLPDPMGRDEQGAPQELVYGLLEGTAGTPSFSIELGRNVVVESQGRTHTMMLSMTHHDVKAQPPRR